MGGELTRRQQEMEDSAQQIKRYCWDEIKMYIDVHKLPSSCVSLLVVMWCSLIEQKVDQMAAELTRRQQEREDTDLQHKRYLLIALGGHTCYTL